MTAQFKVGKNIYKELKQAAKVNGYRTAEELAVVLGAPLSAIDQLRNGLISDTHDVREALLRLTYILGIGEANPTIRVTMASQYVAEWLQEKLDTTELLRYRMLLDSRREAREQRRNQQLKSSVSMFGIILIVSVLAVVAMFITMMDRATASTALLVTLAVAIIAAFISGIMLLKAVFHLRSVGIRVSLE